MVMKKIDPYGEAKDKPIEKPGMKVIRENVAEKESDDSPENKTFDFTVGEQNLDIPIFSEEFLNYNRSRWLWYYTEQVDAILSDQLIPSKHRKHSFTMPGVQNHVLLFIYLSICLFIYLFICLFIYLFMYLLKRCDPSVLVRNLFPRDRLTITIKILLNI